jgi:CHRD domain
MRVRALALLAALAAGLLSAPESLFAQEAHPTFVAEMTGFEETPGAATLAKGFAGIQVSQDGNSVYYSITVTDASANLIAAHLHFGPRGEAGPIVVALCSAQTTPCQTEGQVAQGTFTSQQFEGPFQNDNLQRLIDEARAGMVYANVHSTKYPGGEARGQLVDLGAMLREPEPAAPEGEEPVTLD